ncbi:hypothetical protein GGS21DRAFT_536780 [Xylaria nigripes]|nr:hypothetical protein GGS21DRAFT_536780 [Xylaria nigripes]
MRWLSRFHLKGPAQGARSLTLHDIGYILMRRYPIYHIVAGPSRRGLCSSPSFQTKTVFTWSQSESASTGKSASKKPIQPTPSGQDRNSKAQGARWTALALTFAASAAITYFYRRRARASEDDVINTSTFSPFTILKREEVSPTAFILTLRPRAWVNPKTLVSGRIDEDDEPSGYPSARIQEAWRHGLWSVEIKQPQLQIARHYTPLPPLMTPAHSPSVEESNKRVALEHGEDDEQADLRFLIRKMDGGEMSSYLSRQRVGETIWLRGPHLGFDVARRLGIRNDNSCDGNGIIDQDGRQKGVVFLAGGTGIAPALQIVHRLLDSSNSSGKPQNKPHVSILWANRSSADALGHEQPLPDHRKPSRWFGFWTQKSIDPNMDVQEKQEFLDMKAISSLAIQIEDLRRRHRPNFELSYFVDSEGSFIGASDLKAASASILSVAQPIARGLSSRFASTDGKCTWHSAKAVELLPDDNDFGRSSSSDSAYACTCITRAGEPMTLAHPGVNLLCVSGPDGFIEAYAGAKRWHDGNEMQGGLGGLVGRIQRDKGLKIGEWLVLKL